MRKFSVILSVSSIAGGIAEAEKVTVMRVELTKVALVGLTVVPLGYASC